MPIGKLVSLGVWENDRFIGAVLFGRGGGSNFLKPYGLNQTEGCELVRVALRDHSAPVSQIVAETLSIVRQQSPGLRLVVSYADPAHGHLGTIYQASNWLYLGTTSPDWQYYYKGKWWHRRSRRPTGFGPGPGSTFGRLSDDKVALLPCRVVSGKFRYLMPLDRAIRRRLLPDARPYPTYDDLAEQVSKVRRHPSGVEG